MIEQQRLASGIRTALHVPVTNRNEKGESVLFQAVMNRTSALVLMGAAAFCSREENDTVVNRVNTSRLFGLFGLSGLFGFGVQRNEPDKPNQQNKPNKPE
jgi:hypothetical protein